MKLHKLILTIFILFASFQICFGQDKPKAELIAEFGKTCSEHLMAVYDSFLIMLNNDPTSKGYIVFYGDSTTEGRNLQYIDALKDYGNRIGIDRIILVRGANQVKEKTQFWLVPTGADFPEIDNKFSQPIYKTKTRFDSGDGYINPYTKDIENGFSDLGCNFPPNRKQFAKILLTDKNLNGLIVVNNRNKKEAPKVVNLITKQLTKTYKVPRNRFQFSYRFEDEYGEVELWLVPKILNK